MTWLAGENIHTKGPGKTVSFLQTTDKAGRNAWKAGGDIRTNCVIDFQNQQTSNESNMEWYACNDILTRYNATGDDGSTDPNGVYFTNKSKGAMIWHANRDIETHSKTVFTSEGDGHMTWYAGRSIITKYGTSDNTDDLTKGIIFTQKGKGRTTWWAKGGIGENAGDIQTYIPVHFDWTQAGSDATSILWWAGRHIEIGNNYSTSNPKQSRALFDTNVNDTITLKTN